MDSYQNKVINVGQFYAYDLGSSTDTLTGFGTGPTYNQDGSGSYWHSGSGDGCGHGHGGGSTTRPLISRRRIIPSEVALHNCHN